MEREEDTPGGCMMIFIAALIICGLIASLM